jgi:hypothetical protein
MAKDISWSWVPANMRSPGPGTMQVHAPAWIAPAIQAEQPYRPLLTD